MLAFFRAMLKSWVAKVLLGLLVISFAVWGVSDAFKGRIGDNVVTAGKHKVSAVEFKSIFDNAIKEVSQQNGGITITAADAVREGLFDQVVNDLAQTNAIWDLIRRMGVRASDSMLATRIREIRAFFDPVTGKFDDKSYAAVLAQNNMTVEAFEKGMADQMAEQQFNAGVNVGLRPASTYLAVLTAGALESRDARFFIIDPRSIPQPAPPTDAQLGKFIQENAERLRRPEFRTLSLVRFSAAALAAAMPVDEAQARKVYEDNKARFTTPEKRSFVQIPVTSQAMAQAVAQQLSQGRDAASVAASVGAKPITYTDAERSGVADQGVAQAAFQMQPGQVAPVQGQFGPAIVKLLKVSPGKPADYAQARKEIVANLQTQAAQEKVYDQVQKYDDTHQSGATLIDAAKAAGVKVYPIGPVTDQGQGLDGRPVVGLNKQMLAVAFSQAAGSDSEVTDLGKGEYYALRVEKITPSALPKVDEVRPGLTRAYMMRETVRAMQARADALTARLNKGENFDTVAASAGAKANTLNGVSRINARQYQQLGQNFLLRLIGSKPNEAFSVEAGQFGVAVVKTIKVTPPAAQMAAALGASQRTALTGAMFKEMGELVKTSARDRVKVQINRDRALRAVNVNPDEVGGAAKSGTPAKAAG